MAGNYLDINLPQTYRQKQWTNQEVVKMICLFREYPEMWGDAKKDQRDRHKKTDMYRKAARELATTTDEVKKKWHSLRTQFSRENKRAKEYSQQGDIEEQWQSKWKFFRAMMFTDMPFTRDSKFVKVPEWSEEVDDGPSTECNSSPTGKRIVTATEECMITATVIEEPVTVKQEPVTVKEEPDSPDDDPVTPPAKRARWSLHNAAEWSYTQQQQAPIISDPDRDQDDAAEQFGKYVSAQIRALPPRAAILLQTEIQNVITCAVLANMSSTSR